MMALTYIRCQGGIEVEWQGVGPSCKLQIAAWSHYTMTSRNLRIDMFYFTAASIELLLAFSILRHAKPACSQSKSCCFPVTGILAAGPWSGYQ